ncbi:non-ribosomal peptide synthetase, partial [Paenibacillus sp. P3E]|uniref:non-ribosomal peptide synthetase n=1 Tax=Paenibacillus sp. P3E TaxID=1349435 RepID=UPI002116A697
MTPSRLKLLLEGGDVSCLTHVTDIFVGGEAFPDNLLIEIKKHSNAKLYNMYGPTETTVWSTYELITENVKKITIGKPIANTSILVLNDENNLQPIGIIGEICISGRGLSRGYLNNKELTDEKFIKNPYDSDLKIYKTGDLGRLLPDGKIEFLGRKDTQIKLRGYRIELSEIEKNILMSGLVKDAVVSVIGEELCAFVIMSDSSLVSYLRELLSQQLPSYMIPTRFIQTESFPQTPNGKINKKALNSIALTHTASEKTVVKPNNEYEEKLLGIWTEVLGVNDISVEDNFFEIGGHSLNATHISTRISKYFNIHISVSEVMKNPTIKALAVIITQKGSKALLPITRITESEYYEVTQSQKRLYIIEQSEGSKLAYNMPIAIRLSGQVDIVKLEESLNTLVMRHEAFRTSFKEKNGRIIQVIEPEFCFEINQYNTNEESLSNLLEELVTPFDLSKSPLFRAFYIQVADGNSVLLFDMHHIIFDGTSLSLIFEELSNLLNDKNLPNIETQFKDYVYWQNQFMQTDLYKKQEEYWLDVFADEISRVSLPLDYPRPLVATFSGDVVNVNLGKTMTEQINKMVSDTNTTLYVLFLSVLNIVLAKYSEQEDIIIGSPIVNRSHPSTQNIVGMLTNTIAIRNKPQKDKTFNDFLNEVKENTLKAIENQDYQYSDLIEKLDIVKKYGINSVFDVWFVLQNMNFSLEIPGATSAYMNLEQRTSKFDLLVEAIENNGEISIGFNFNTNLFKRESIETFSGHFYKLLELISMSPGKKIGNYEILNDLELLEVYKKKNFNVANAISNAKDALSVVINSTFTADPIANYITWWTNHFGLNVSTKITAYNQFMQHLLNESKDPTNSINILLFRFEDLLRDNKSDDIQQIELLNKYYRQLVAILANKHKSGPLFMGIFKVNPLSNLSSMVMNHIASLNREMIQSINNMANAYTIDFSVEDVCYAIGERFDLIKDKNAHLPFTDEYEAVLGTIVARKIVAYENNIYKVIVLDCDNTIWNGICGEDGPLGVAIDGPYLELQNFMVKKYQEGYLLALCSKNNEKDVWEVFDRNPEMVLKKEHFITHRINWTNKSANLLEISDELGFGLESFIFIDDSKYECSDVMAACPKVLTLKLPEDSQAIPSFINHVWAFDTLDVTEEDKKRNAMYISENKRKAIQNTVTTLDEYLMELELVVSITDTLQEEFSRIAQLTQRTNQFNFNKNAMTEDVVNRYISSLQNRCFSVHVKDKFGDYGLVGAVLVTQLGERVVINNFMLSCRVLGRGVENAVIVSVLNFYKSIVKMELKYKRTEKNDLVAEYLEKMNYSLIEEHNGVQHYEIDTSDLPAVPKHITCLYTRIDQPQPKPISEPIERLQIDHIGIAVADINEAKCYYEQLGFKCSTSIYDENQNANLLMCTKSGFDSIELVEPVDHNSPVYNIINKNGEIPYHICFRVPNIKCFIEILEESSIVFESVTNVKPAILFNHKNVQFIYLKNMGLIELLEDPDCSDERIVNMNNLRMVVPVLSNSVGFFERFGYKVAINKQDTVHGTYHVIMAKENSSSIEIVVPSVQIVTYENELLHKNGPGVSGICFAAPIMTNLEDKPYIYSLQPVCETDIVFYQWDVFLSNINDLMNRSYFSPLMYPTAKQLLQLPIYSLFDNFKKSDGEKRQPVSITQKKVISIWEEILRIESIGIDDNFFEIGGHSLKATSLASSIYNIFNVEVTLNDIFNNPTVSLLSNFIQYQLNNEVTSNRSYSQVTPQPSYMHDPFGLTDVQTAYLLGRQSDFEMGGVSTHQYVEIESRMDISRLNISLIQVIQRHPMLRAVFDSNGSQRILQNVPPYAIKVEDLVSLDHNTQQERILKERERMSHAIFDPSSWPLFEFKAFRLSENVHYLCIGIDILVADATSIDIMGRELMAYYQDQSLKLPELNLSFRDYILAYNEFKKSEVYELDRKHWMKKIEDFPSAPSIPLKVNPETIKEPRFRTISHVITASDWNEIKNKAKMKNITTAVLLATAYAEILGFWSNQSHLALNFSVFNRYPVHSEVGQIVGDFTSVLLIEADLREGKSFWDHAFSLQRTMFESLQHRHYDGIKFIRDLAARNGSGTRAIMPYVFTNILSDENSLEKMNSSFLSDDINVVKFSSSQTSQVYLDNQVVESNGSLTIRWDYVEELFDKDMIREMFEGYIKRIVQTATDENVATTIINNEFNFKQIEQYNNTGYSYSCKTLHSHFYEQVKMTPNNIAIVKGHESITYQKLDERSNQVARFLLENNIGNGDIVAVWGNRDIETIINLLAILKVGAAYLPIEPDYPDDRKRLIIRDAGCKFVLDGSTDHAIKTSVYSDAKIIDYVSPDSLAYIIYTSGSTGVPKGVVVKHKAVVNTILDVNKKFEVTESDRIIALSSLCFDLSVYDVFGSLLSGATLILVPDVRDTKYVMETMQLHKVTVWNSVPALADMMVDAFEDDYVNTHLRVMLLSGDWIPLKLPSRISKHFRNANLISLGGATEAAIWSIYYPINEVDLNWKSIPYGYPLANQQVYVLNYNLEFCPIGVKGDLYIAGEGLANGYYNDPIKTQDAFINHPSLGPIYKTGDQGVLCHKGYIEFLGRNDSQVKIRGFRIELGEVENYITALSVINKALVNCYENERGIKLLCAYYIADSHISKEEIKAHLEKCLPDYMIPTYYIQLQEFPLTYNGKIDKKLLPKPENEMFSKREVIEPRNSIEQQVLEFWQELLEKTDISIDDNFFDLGGDSLKIQQLVNRVDKFFSKRLAVRKLFQNPTIEGIAKELLSGNTIVSAISSLNSVSAKIVEQKKYWWSPVLHWSLNDGKLIVRNEKFESELIDILFPDFYFMAQQGMNFNQLVEAFPQIEPSSLESFMTMLYSKQILVDSLLSVHDLFHSQGTLFQNHHDDTILYDNQSYQRFKTKQLQRTYEFSGEITQLKGDHKFPTFLTERRSQREFNQSKVISKETFEVLLSFFKHQDINKGIKYLYPSAGGLYPIDIYLY